MSFGYAGAYAPSPSPIPYLYSPPYPPRGDGEAEAPEPEPPPPAEAVPPCPQRDIIDLYHQTLPECPRVKVWPEAGRKQLAARWREDKTRQHLDWWRRVFGEVAKSDFLMGRADGRSFTFSLTWFVKPTNFAKVLNGNYENRTPVERGGKQIGGLSF